MLTTDGMASSENISPCSPSWASLVQRSLAVWGSCPQGVRLAKDFLESFTDLDDFLGQPREIPMYWFFQRRKAFLSQERLAKWSRDRLDDYILLPAFPGYVTRTDCFFVSHFWCTHEDPDPNGEYLSLFQNGLRPHTWEYVWVDWTCAPQAPRTPQEENYFIRTMETMSGIIRNCGFMWHYPPFEARMWILYEIAEYSLTCDGGIELTEDNQKFCDHITEMVEVGVHPTLEKYGYRCTFDRDQEFLPIWLEALVLFKSLHFSVEDIRRFQDQITWHPSIQVFLVSGTVHGTVELCRHEGTLTFGGQSYKFTPFPNWTDGKYFANATLRSSEDAPDA